MRQCYLLFIILSIGFSGTAQREIAVAQRAYEAYAFKPAQDIYERLLAHGIENADLLKRLGNTYYFNAEYAKAADKYGRLVTSFPEEVTPEYYFRYAQALISSGNPVLAEAMLNRFSELKENGTDKRIGKYDQRTDVLSEIDLNSGRYDIFEFSDNSEYSEFAPSFYNGELLFASDRDTGNLARYRHTWNRQDFLDLYVASEKATGSTKSSKFSALNSRFHESTSVFTQDGATVYFTRSGPVSRISGNAKSSIGQLKIFRSKWFMGAWSEPESLSINSDAYSTANPALSPDGKTLYFSSDRPGGQGASDIWKVALRQDGSLGTPENLGPEINTPYRETFPFITSENILYFSSDGHPGLGGLDVFATEISNLSHGGKILNVGRPVNSPQDDFTFIFSEDSKKGYFASNRPGGKGKDDIFGIIENIPLSFSCEQEISGTVRDKITNEVLSGATVRIINEDNVEIATAITDAKGQYLINRDCNLGSFVRASREGYIATEEYLTASSGKPRIIDFYLEPETVYGGYGDDLAKLFQLSTIYFDFDRWEIRADAEIEIMKIVAAMEKYPSLKVTVNSHTDSRGPDAYNLWLSQKRAESTVKYMISKGISPDRLTGRGYGETQLINPCSNGKSCSDAEHSRNRRSEFIIQE